MNRALSGRAGDRVDPLSSANSTGDTAVADRAATGSPVVPRPPRPAVGPLLVAISVIHLAFTPVFYGSALGDIFDDGVINALESGGTLIDSRDAAFWYFSAGLGIALFGYLAWWVEHRAGTLPAILGWLLVAFTVVNVLLIPESGFWLFLVPAAAVLVRARRQSVQGVTASQVSAS